MPFNLSYVVPSERTTSQYIVPINANPPYLISMTQQPLLVSEIVQHVSVSASSYAISSSIQQPTAPSETSSKQQQLEKSSNQE